MVMGSLTTSQKGTGHGVHRPQVTEELVMGFCKHKSQRNWSWGSPTTSHKGVDHGVPRPQVIEELVMGFPITSYRETTSHKEVGHEVSRQQVTEELVMGFPTTSHKGDGHGFWFTLRFWILYPGAFTCKHI